MPTTTNAISRSQLGTGWVSSPLPDWRAVARDGSNKWPWEYEANLDASIDTYRRGDCRITVVNGSNAPISGASVSAVQREHTFPFGNIFTNGMVCDSADVAGGAHAASAFTSYRAASTIDTLDRSTYRDKMLNFGFNAWKAEASWGHGVNWTGSAPFSKQVTRDCTAWLLRQKKWAELSAHAILYPLDQNWLWPTTPYGNTTAEKRAYWQSTDWPERAAFLDKFVDCYTLVNELQDSFFGGHTSSDLVSDLLFAQTLTNRTCMLMDYKNGGTMRAAADYLIGQGVKIDTVAWQAHYDSANTLAGRAQAYGDFNRRSDNSTVAPWGFSLSEYDSRNISRLAMADNLEYTYKAGFANPACQSIYSWGFWEPISWLHEVFGVTNSGFFDIDWNISPTGQRFHDLVNVAWKTSSSGSTNGSGYHQFRGTFGAYDLTVTSGPTTVTRSFELHPGMREIVIVIP